MLFFFCYSSLFCFLFSTRVGFVYHQQTLSLETYDYDNIAAVSWDLKKHLSHVNLRLLDKANRHSQYVNIKTNKAYL